MNKEEKKYELIKFEDGEFNLDVNVSPDEDTVWLTKQQISELYGRDRSVISKHIKNILSEHECDKSNVQKMHIANSDKPVEIYNLNIILSVGYRVKSNRGNQFRIWANSILKQYLLTGSVINEKRCLSCTSNIISLQNKVEIIESKIKNITPNYIYNDELMQLVNPYNGHTFKIGDKLNVVCVKANKALSQIDFELKEE